MGRTQAVTILFCDLVSSTERRARLGDDAFDEFTARFMAVLRAAIREADGREVSSAGDGLMVVFPESVADAVACAGAMHREVAGLDPRDPPRLRIGISCGEVAQDGPNYSGMPIVEAARLEAAASPGTTLASAVVRSLLGSRRGFHFRDVGALSLKGLPAALPAVAVDDDPDSAPGVPPASPTPPRRARPRRGALLVAVAVVALVVAGVAVVATRDDPSGNGAAAAGVPTPVGYTPRLENMPCPSGVRALDVGASCAHLLVPEDRSKPHGRQVSLLVERAPAREPGSAVAPSIDLCGCEDLGNSITRDHAELIQLSARGFPGSEPMLSCPEMSAERISALAERSNDDAEVKQGAAALRSCEARIAREGIDPAQYNYRVAAADALDLMTALHVDHADFTASGLVGAEVFEIVRRAPGAVRSITIDNPAPPGETELSEPVTDLAQAFERFVARCNDDAACARGYPDLAGAWREAYQRNDTEAPVLSASDPDDPGLGATPVLVDGPRSADALASALDDARNYSLIPVAITSTSADAVVAGEVARSDFYSFHPDAPWGTLASYLCAYDVHTQDADAVALAASIQPQFTRAWTSYWNEWCKAWKVPDVSDALSADVVSPVPALLFRGDLTAFGNDDWLRRIERGLSHAQSVRFPTLGGNLLTNGPSCLSDLRRKFLADPMTRLDTQACAKQSPPIDFVIPS